MSIGVKSITRGSLNYIKDGTYNKVSKSTYEKILTLKQQMDIIRGDKKNKEYLHNEEYIKCSKKIKEYISNKGINTYTITYNKKPEKLIHKDNISANFMYYLGSKKSGVANNSKLFNIHNISEYINLEFDMVEYLSNELNPIVDIYTHYNYFNMCLSLTGKSLFVHDDFNNVIYNNIIKKLSLPFNINSNNWTHDLDIILLFVYHYDSKCYNVHVCSYNLIERK